MQDIPRTRHYRLWEICIMFGQLWRLLKYWEKKSRHNYSHNIEDPEERQKSLYYTRWIDHEILRIYWHNF